MSVVIPTRNRLAKLERCLSSVPESTYRPLEIIVVDDASSISSKPNAATLPLETKIITNSTRQLLAYSREEGARASHGKYLFFLDDDNLVDPLAIQELVDLLERRVEIAVGCPIIYYLQHPMSVWTSHISKGFFPGFYKLRTDLVRDGQETVSFHDAFMVKRDAFFEVGGFDYKNFPMHFSELDLARRFQKRGYSACVSSKAKVWHEVSPAHMHVDSSRSYYTLRNRIIFLRKHERVPQKMLYVIYIIPLLYIYYCIHHMRATDESPRKIPLLILDGIINGLATRIE